MTRTAAIRGLLTLIVLLASSVTHAYTQTPSPVQMLDPKLAPKFEDVAISAPTPDELQRCTVEFIQGPVAKSGGWLLKDPKGLPIRGFFDTTGRVDMSGRTKVDTWKYYKDGIEVYREFDTAAKGIPNNFRWLNSGGMKWGIGGVNNGKGLINSWRMISAEEVGQEAFHAIARQDFARLQALFITDAEIQGLKLSSTKAATIRTNQQQAQQRFAEVCKTLNLQGARFDVVEGGIVECNTRHDVEFLRYADRQVRYEIKGELKFLRTHEMIQVGMAWRLVDVPASEAPAKKGNDELDKLLQQLSDLDLKTPPAKNILDNDQAIEMYYRKRIPLVQKIIPLDDAKNRDGWYKQLFDNLVAMAQNSGDKATIGLLTQMKDDAVSKFPGSNLAAYGVYRDLWCKYSLAMAAKDINPKVMKEIQDRWTKDLTDFVNRYSKSDDAPEALHQLAIGAEFDGRNEESKRWYKRLSEDFSNHHLAARSRGSEARLSLVGAEIRLAGPLLEDPLKGFDIATLKGKVVVVHYWASYSDQYKDDFVRMQRVVSAAKDVVLVNINLDDNAAKAREAVTRSQAPGIHLFQATNNAAGLNSPLAIQYGIHILPTIFVVGKDGRVTNNNVQVGDLEPALRNAQ